MWDAINPKKNDHASTKIYSRSSARRNVEPQEQGVPQASKVQPQVEVTNVEFCEAIWMLSKVVTNQGGQLRGNRQEVADTLRIHEFLRMNLPSLTGSSVTEDPESFVEDLQKFSKSCMLKILRWWN